MRRAHAATLLATASFAASLLAACEGTTSIAGPGTTELSARTGGAVTVAGLSGEALLGRWTRIDGVAPGVILETTFTFLGGGTGARVVTTRTALGGVISEDRQPFTWTAGGGVVLIRIRGALGSETILRASFAVEADLTGTTLRLDGLPYRRAAS